MSSTVYGLEKNESESTSPENGNGSLQSQGLSLSTISAPESQLESPGDEGGNSSSLNNTGRRRPVPPVRPKRSSYSRHLAGDGKVKRSYTGHRPRSPTPPPDSIATNGRASNGAGDSKESSNPRQALKQSLLRKLDSSKKQNLKLTTENDKLKEEVFELKQHIRQLNNDLREEKKASNIIISGKDDEIGLMEKQMLEVEETSKLAVDVGLRVAAVMVAAERDSSKRKIEAVARDKEASEERHANEMLNEKRKQSEVVRSAKNEIEARKRMCRQVVDVMSDRVVTEKSERRAAQSKLAQQKLDSMKNFQLLGEMVDEMYDESMQYKKEAKAASSKVDHEKSVRMKFAEKLRCKSDRLNDANEELDDVHAELEEMRKTLNDKIKGCTAAEKQIDSLNATINKLKSELPKKIEKVPGKKGFKKWPIWMVQLIIEFLIHGTPPSAIAANILTQSQLQCPETRVEDLPSVNFIRSCRAYIGTISTTLAAMQLAEAEEWIQAFFDETKRRQINLQNLAVAIKKLGKFHPLVLSCNMINKDGCHKTQAKAIIDYFDHCANLLDGFKEVVERLFPDYEHGLPSRDALTVSKMHDGACVNTDTSFPAVAARRETIRMFVERCEEDPNVDNAKIRIHDLDCMHHCRNLWVLGARKRLDKFVAESIDDTIKEIKKAHPNLMITCKLDGILFALEKCFGETCNYYKGKGEEFVHHMRHFHPGDVLFPLERAVGSRHDGCTAGACALYHNHRYYVDYAHECLCEDGFSHALLEAMFISLSSTEIIAYARIMAIVHVAIVIPMRFVIGKTQDFAEYDFAATDISLMIEVLEDVMLRVKEDPELFLDENFMMTMFHETCEQLPPLQEHLDYVFGNKKSCSIGDISGVRKKSIPYQDLRAELFNPTFDTNVGTTDLCLIYIPEAADAFLEELWHKKKRTHHYLSSQGGEKSYLLISDEDRCQMMGKSAANDFAESPFATLTGNLHWFGRIGLHYAGGMAQATLNGDFERGSSNYIKRPSGSREEETTLGAFIQLPMELRHCLVQFAIEKAPEYKSKMQQDLFQQREEQKRRKEIAMKRSVEASQKAYLKALSYRDQYGKPACWRTPEEVDEQLATLDSDSKKLKLLHRQIAIRVIGFGWSDLHIAKTVKGQAKPVGEIAAHLKYIMEVEKTRQIPKEPPTNMPAPKCLEVLGTPTQHWIRLQSKSKENEDSFRKEAVALRDRQEEEGLHDPIMEQQQTSMPDFCKMKGSRIQMCFEVVMPDNTLELWWCDGTILNVGDEDDREVTIRFDKQSLLEGEEPVQNHKIMKRKWNPKAGKAVNGSWRMLHH